MNNWVRDFLDRQSDGNRENGEFDLQFSERVTSSEYFGAYKARVAYEEFTETDGTPDGWRVSGELLNARLRYGEDGTGAGTLEAGVGKSVKTPSKVMGVELPAEAGLSLFGGVYIDSGGIGASLTATGYARVELPTGKDYRGQVNTSYRLEIIDFDRERSWPERELPTALLFHQTEYVRDRETVISPI